MKNLKMFIEQKNTVQKMFGGPVKTFPLTQENVDSLFESLDWEISPESLKDLAVPKALLKVEMDRKYRWLVTIYQELEAYCKRNSLTTPTVQVQI